MHPHDAPIRREQRIVRVSPDGWVRDDDLLATEEPLEIRLLWWEGDALNEKPVAVTMRTPGDDFELAVGFLFGEGILKERYDFSDVGYCLDENEIQNENIVNVTLMPGVTFDMSRLDRNFYTTSSCGVCGKAALEALEIQGCDVVISDVEVSPELIQQLPDRLREAQEVFQKTGGLHASGLFTPEGELVSLREDVGRHNALDKVIGEQLLKGKDDLSDRILLLSGRASFELIQKSLMARIPVVAAVGAPSSLAVELAQEFGITLMGFVRPDGFNIYTHPGRVRIPASYGYKRKISTG
ncbi:MAG: formate dehydrogenase accessory sulfurtransferase FdhD [Chloroflexota bacterium]